MKLRLTLLALLALPTVACAQSEQYDVTTLLQDSAYVFNRFDEMTTGLDSQIEDWKIPETTKALFKREISSVAKNVNAEKPKLNSLLTKRNVSATELFDVYLEVIEVSGTLAGQSSNAANWGNDSGSAIQLAEIGAKANVLAAKIGFILRSKIKDQETQLESCDIKRSTPMSPNK